MATRVMNASERIRTSLQYYPEHIIQKYDKNVHNQVLRLCFTLDDITSLCSDIYSARYTEKNKTVEMQNLVTDMMQDWYVLMGRLEAFCRDMREDGYEVSHSMSSYLQGLRSARAEVVHHSEPVFDYEMSDGSFASYVDSAVTPYFGECIRLYVAFDGPKGKGRQEELSILIGNISREVAHSLIKTSRDLENVSATGSNWDGGT